MRWGPQSPRGEQPPNILHISGGEPTLSDKLLELCTTAHERFEHVLLSTNGLKFADFSFAKAVAQTNIDCIVVPFFSDDPKLHDYVVGRRGSFQLLINGLKNIMQLRNPRLTTIVYKIIAIDPILTKVTRIPAFLIKENLVPDEVQISGLHIKGSVLKHPEIIPEAKALSNQISGLIYELRNKKIPFSVYDLPWCILQNEALEYLLADGILRSDTGMRDYTKVYWKGERKDARETHRFTVCEGCDLTDFCNGYYPVNIEMFSQRMLPFLKRIKFAR